MDSHYVRERSLWLVIALLARIAKCLLLDRTAC